MSYLDGTYISPVGTDFTEFVNTAEDYAKFEELCELENQTFRPLRECLPQVLKAIKLGRELQGKQTTLVQIKTPPVNPKLN